ncbi:hypothetical protein JRK10_004884 [Salmonella enterica]|nr:hypothetical protein [Salmonella enterica subsp. enterica serovar Duisburg]EAQ9999298.1 hypothetical protein [Salmonella enterica]EAS5079817.1 hypothetical protein [Salmonella enterica]EAU9597437.1 hypothetical protein [Salmonella enterica]EAX8253092.1 hypothetical protein [Salmonella enterica]
MIIIRNLHEDDNLITYKDIALSFTELTRQRSIAIDSLRSEAKSLYECFVDSLALPLEGRVIKDERAVASIEQRSGGTGDYVRRSPLALESPDANDIAFRMCVILDYTPPRISILPVYVMLSHDGGMIKVRLSLSEMDDEASVFYVSRCGEKDRYDETAECIKNLLMKGISDRRPNIPV